MKKKKLFVGILMASAVFGLAACGGNTGTTTTSGTTTTETTTQQGDTKYSVKFMDGTTEVSSVEVAQGGKVTKPATNPTKAEDNNNTYEFVTWCKDSALTTEFNFETETISAATTIYAKFAAVSKDTVIKMNGTEYASITAAFAAIPATSTDTFEITLPKGTYNEDAIRYTGSATIKIKGNTAAKYGADVIITGHGSNMGKEKERELFEIQGSANIILENVTLLSDWSRADHTGDVQAEVLGTDTTGYTVAYNCGFKSHQDTLRTTGKAWFYGCYIEGDTDFMWMEEGGKVALYENCEIVSLYDEHAESNKHRSYLTAPRMAISTKVGKGLVIYNSTVKETEAAKDGQQTYLARTPWQSGVYNQVAYIHTTCEGIEASVWYGSQIATEYSKTVIGWKMDKFTADSIGYAGNDDIVDDATVAKEFNGRKSILNRVYDTGKQKYEKDAANVWDIDAVISANGFLVDVDSSSDTIEGEVVGETTTYLFDGTTDQSALCEGFAKQNGDDKPHYVGNNGATITIPVSGKCYVEVYGYYSGTVEAKAGSQGEGVMFFNNGSTKAEVINTYAVYDASATSVVLTAKATTYIRKVVVTTDSTIEEKKVTSIEVTGNRKTNYIGVSLQLTANITPKDATNKSVKWSSTDESIGTVDPYTGKAKFLKEGTVKFIATACDGSGVTGEITCKPIDGNWSEIEWYTTDSTVATETGATGINFFDVTTYKQIKDVAGNNKSYTYTNLKGESFTTGYGMKLNSSGKMNVCTLKPATLTIVIAPHQNLGVIEPSVVDEDTNGSPIKATVTTEGELTIYTYKLPGAGSWKITRGDGNEDSPILYAKCVVDDAISSDTSLLFGSADGNYESQKAFNITATIVDNGTNNSKIYGGNIEFNVEAGAQVEVYANWGQDYIINGDDGQPIVVEGTNVGNDGKKFYTYTKRTTVVIQCDPDNDGDNYFYWIKVTFPNE